MIDWIRNGAAWQVFGGLGLFAISAACLLIGANRKIKWIGWGTMAVSILISGYGILSNEIDRGRNARTQPPSTNAGRDIISNTQSQGSINGNNNQQIQLGPGERRE